VATLQIRTDDALRLVHRIQIITIAWMSIEAALSLWSAWKAQSPALLAFGGDSAVELLSAIVVLRRFRRHASADAEKHAARIAGSLLFVLAGCVILVSLLSLKGYSEPKSSYLGIAVLVMAALIMPWLASKKRQLSAVTGSAAMRADAAQSAACFYLSIVALIGLLLHATFHIELADPIAALVITPLLLLEGRQALRGKACGCC
jgi:divalent metal cation (Fe/Co/Zn/Cd) transporter